LAVTFDSGWISKTESAERIFPATGLVIFLIDPFGCATFRVDKISLGSRRIAAGSGAGSEREFR
jgi:hypothetical protein